VFLLLLGTNGGVSVAGTVSSALGGSIVGLAYYVVVLVCAREDVNSPAQWPVIIVTTLTGLLGSLIDSLLGATLQYSGQSTADLTLVAVLITKNTKVIWEKATSLKCFLHS